MPEPTRRQATASVPADGRATEPQAPHQVQATASAPTSDSVGPLRVPSLLRSATQRLAEQPDLADQASSDARLLLAHVLGRTPSELALIDQIETGEQHQFWALVEQRATGVPVQHLTGRAWFRNVELAVGPGVFIPRPETEVMTGRALDLIAKLGADQPGRSVRVVELCAGSGAISAAIADEAPTTQLHAVELSEAAYGFAAQNLSATGVDLVLGDMADAFIELDGTVDIVVTNPPYVPLESWEQVPAQVRDHDPTLALFSGLDGLDAMAVVARTAARLLRAGGVVLAEHAEVQHESVVDLFTATGDFAAVRDHRDLAGRWRFVEAVRR